MAQHHEEFEFEGKRALTERQFEQLCTEHKPEGTPFITQHNHYFDTADFQLKERNAALRIRLKEDEMTLTLKIKMEDGAHEKHDRIPLESWSTETPLSALPDATVLSWLEEEWGISKSSLLHLGTLSTHRATWNSNDGSYFLDHSEYLGTSDFELEFEGSSTSHVNLVLKQLAKTYPFLLQNDDPSPKVKRFFDRKKSLQEKM